MSNTPLLSPLRYWLQPILRVDECEQVIAHELLCRWGDTLSWFERDKALLQALCTDQKLPAGSLHINLGPGAVIALPPGLIEPVCERFGKRLVLEWTEQASSKTDVQIIAKRLNYWRNRYGVQISVDDFGSGHDGIDRVLSVNPDNVKIDGGLFRRVIDGDSHASNILHRVCEWLFEQATPVIFEHIETAEDLVFAKKLGANMGQGFLWSHLATEVQFAGHEDEQHSVTPIDSKLDIQYELKSVNA